MLPLNCHTGHASERQVELHTRHVRQTFTSGSYQVFQEEGQAFGTNNFFTHEEAVTC